MSDKKKTVVEGIVLGCLFAAIIGFWIWAVERLSEFKEQQAVEHKTNVQCFDPQKTISFRATTDDPNIKSIKVKDQTVRVRYADGNTIDVINFSCVVAYQEVEDETPQK